MTARKPILAACLLYLVFVIYGSLVPLQFRDLPWDQAWASFRAIPYLSLGIGSRADWVANILLFIPLAFLGLGALWPQKRIGLQLAASVLVLTVCIGLTVSIEFSQLFFPPRTVSQNDIQAETLGSLIGIALWWWKGLPAAQWIRDFITRHDGTTERLLWLYLLVLFGYNLLPLDLTISPVELHDKWRQGKVLLLPFSGLPGGLVESAYSLFTDMIIWTPVSLLFILSGKHRPLQAWWLTLAAAMVLEAAQLLVYSRVTDITDILCAGLGGGIGVIIARRFRSPSELPARHSLNARLVGSLLASLGWCLLLCAVFWYPYDFHLEGDFLRPRLAGLYQLPFVSYYYSTEFRAVTEVFHKMGFFLPLGALLGYASLQIFHYRWRSAFTLFALAVIPAMAFLIELGQVALPGKYPGNTDVVLETLGAYLGLLGVKWLVRRFRYPQRPVGRSIP